MCAIHALGAEDAARIEASHSFPSFSAVVEAVLDVVKGIATVSHVHVLRTLSHLPCTRVDVYSIPTREALSVRLQDLAVHVEEEASLCARVEPSVVAAVTGACLTASGADGSLPPWLDLSTLNRLSQLVNVIELRVLLIPGEAARTPSDDDDVHTLLSVRWDSAAMKVLASHPSIPLDSLSTQSLASDAPIALRIRVMCAVMGVFYHIPVRHAALSGSPRELAATQRRLLQLGLHHAMATLIAPFYLTTRHPNNSNSNNNAEFLLTLNEAMPCQRGTSLVRGLRPQVVHCVSKTITEEDKKEKKKIGLTTPGERLCEHVLRTFLPTRLPAPCVRCLREVTVVPGRFTALFWARGFLEQYCAATCVGPRRRRGRVGGRARSADGKRDEVAFHAPVTPPAPLTIISRVPDAVLQRAASAVRQGIATPVSSVQSSSAFCYVVDEAHDAYQIARRYFSVSPFLILVDPDLLDADRRTVKGKGNGQSHFESCFAEAVRLFHGGGRTCGAPGSSASKTNTAVTAAVEAEPLRAEPQTQTGEMQRAKAADAADTSADENVDDHRDGRRGELKSADKFTSTVVARMCKGPLRRHDPSTQVGPTTVPDTPATATTATTSALRFRHLLDVLSAQDEGGRRGGRAVCATPPRMSAASARRSAAFALARASSGAAAAAPMPSRPHRTPVVLCSKGKGLASLATTVAPPPLTLTGQPEHDLGELRRLLGSTARTRTTTTATTKPLSGTAHDDVGDGDVITTRTGTAPESPHAAAAWAENWSTLVHPGFARPQAWMPTCTGPVLSSVSTRDTAQSNSGASPGPECALLHHARLAVSQVYQWDRKFLVVVVPPDPTTATTPTTERDDAFAEALRQRRWAAHSSRHAGSARPSSLPPHNATVSSTLAAVKRCAEWWLADQHAVHERIRLEWFLAFAEAYVLHPELDTSAAAAAEAAEVPAELTHATGECLIRRIGCARQLVRRLCATHQRHDLVCGLASVTALPEDLVEAVTALESVLMMWGWRFTHRHSDRRCVAVTHWSRVVVEGVKLSLTAMQDLRWVVEELQCTHMDLSDADAVCVVVPSAVLQFFISRSCRGAIMFGHSLTAEAARTLVEAMVTATQYYVCSHGRACLCRLSPLRTC